MDRKPENLKVLEFTSKYDNETHTFSNTWIVIDTSTLEVLCQGIRAFPYHVYHPIQWVSYQGAQKWINEGGCIGDIQENHSNLNVGFKKEFIGE